MNRPKTIDGTPVRTSIKNRTSCANQLFLPYSTSHTATPTPIGTAISEASATISIVPKIALLIPPMLELLKNVLPVGSVVKKLGLHILQEDRKSTRLNSSHEWISY